MLEVDLTRALAGRSNLVLERLADGGREARLFHASLLVRLGGAPEELVETLELLRPSIEGLLSTFPGSIFLTETVGRECGGEVFPVEEFPLCGELFGNVPGSMLTLFQLLTLFHTCSKIFQ